MALHTAIDGLGARIMSMLTALCCNVSQWPSIYVFTLPTSNAHTPGNEVFADVGGAPNWFEAWVLAFTATSDNIPGGQLHGQDHDQSSLLDYCGPNHGLNTPNPLLAAQFSAVASTAETTFEQRKILAFERPPIKNFASTNIAPLLLCYCMQRDIQDPRTLAVGRIFDSTSVTKRVITDPLLLPWGTTGGNDGYLFQRDPNMPAAAFIEQLDSGTSYTERYEYANFFSLAQIVQP